MYSDWHDLNKTQAKYRSRPRLGSFCFSLPLFGWLDLRQVWDLWVVSLLQSRSLACVTWLKHDSNILKHTQTCSNILKHTQTHSNILQHTQTYSNILKHMRDMAHPHTNTDWSYFFFCLLFWNSTLQKEQQNETMCQSHIFEYFSCLQDFCLFPFTVLSFNVYHKKHSNGTITVHINVSCCKMHQY